MNRTAVCVNEQGLTSPLTCNGSVEAKSFLSITYTITMFCNSIVQ